MSPAPWHQKWQCSGAVQAKKAYYNPRSDQRSTTLLYKITTERPAAKAVRFCDLCELQIACECCSSQNASSAAPMPGANAGLDTLHHDKTPHRRKGRAGRLGGSLRHRRVLSTTAHATKCGKTAAAGRRVHGAVDGLARREAAELVVPRGAHRRAPTK